MSFAGSLLDSCEPVQRQIALVDTFKPNGFGTQATYSRSARDGTYSVVHQLPAFPPWQFFDDPSESDDLLVPPGGMSQAEQDAYDTLRAAVMGMCP